MLMDGWMDGRMDGWMDGWMDGGEKHQENIHLLVYLSTFSLIRARTSAKK